MAKVIFVKDNIEKVVPDGTPIIQAARESGASIRFGCTMAQCGTCFSTVVEGIENMAPPEDAEKALLSVIGASQNQRLCCQARVMKGTVKIVQD